LQAAHERGYVHRDVKPGNILVIAEPGGKITVKLTDFGIAKAADAAPVTRSGMVMGTAHYIAPEQALGHDAEPASDVYSLAVVGYECLSGHRPFLSENAVTVAMMHIRDLPPPLPPDVPPGIRALVEATLVKDPRQRYRSGGEFAAAVAAVRAGLPLPTPSGLLAPPMPVVAHAPAMPPGAGLPAGLPVPPPGMPHPSLPMAPPMPVRRRFHPLWLLVALLVIALIVLGVLAIGQALRASAAGTPVPAWRHQTTSRAHAGDSNPVASTSPCVGGAVTPTGDVPIGTVETVGVHTGGEHSVAMRREWCGHQA
jgi:serine/threonine-protein kinase